MAKNNKTHLISVHKMYKMTGISKSRLYAYYPNHPEEFEVDEIEAIHKVHLSELLTVIKRFNPNPKGKL